MGKDNAKGPLLKRDAKVSSKREGVERNDHGYWAQGLTSRWYLVCCHYSHVLPVPL